MAEVLAEHRPTLMKRVGIADRYAESAPNDSLLEKYGLTAAHIVQACWSVIDAAQVLESPAAHA